MRDKRVLLGRRLSDNMRVIIKASQTPDGQSEIKSEKQVQDVLSRAIFSQEVLHFPGELYYGQSNDYLLRITAFIEQDRVFAAYPLEEQFFMVMREFETQESFYANTFEHMKIVAGVFPVTHADDYIRQFAQFNAGPDQEAALRLLQQNQQLIETRSNYLTHTDFVPSNFRVGHKKVYMIDLSSMHFANRYEGLARFLNWCVIHDRALEEKILEYIRENRGPEELLCLRLMRIYKAGFLINHYAKKLEKTEGKLHALTELRLSLWQHILERLMGDAPVEPERIALYKAARNPLRSEEELVRQKEFNLL